MRRPARHRVGRRSRFILWRVHVLVRVAAAVAGLAVLGSLASCGKSGSDASGADTTAQNTTSSAPPFPGTGSISQQPLARVHHLTGVQTQVVLDRGFVTALRTLDVTCGAVGRASVAGTVLTFPITSGDLAYYAPGGAVQPFLQGSIHHDGSGISLTAGSTRVELRDFDIEPGASEVFGELSVDGRQTVSHAGLFELDGTGLEPLQLPTPDTAVLRGIEVKLSPDGAQVLDKAFGTTALHTDLLVGTATITIATDPRATSSP